MIIRLASHDDVVPILKAEKANGEKVDEYCREVYEAYIEDPDMSVLIAMHKQDHVAGVIVLDNVNSVIFHVFSIPEMRSHGLGRQLLESGLAILDLTQTDTSLDVVRNNAHAVTLYEKFGFAQKPDSCEDAHQRMVRKPFAHLSL